MTDDIGAFVPGPRVRIEGRAGGPLAGLTFAAKDLFDVAGVPTGGGNHDWPTGRPLPTKHAWAVQTLLNAGATLIGKTITDEVSLGILGENAFDGTPLNPKAPDHVPGGSSSGSASAVAQGLCDTALGTDTGGSVRVPASFCGLYGIRPTHGRLDLAGMMRQAPTSDTTGWFARDAATFARVSAVMLGEAIPDDLPRRLIVAQDAFALADPETAAALEPIVARLGGLIGEVRQEARGRMRQLLPAGTILCLPTTPFPAPLCGQPLSVLEPLRDRITALCAHGGLTGVPQLSIPAATVDGRPVGLSILGGRGSDAMLVAVARVLS